MNIKIDSFIDGMSSFDIMPSCDFELEDLSPMGVLDKVSISFEKVGKIMYQVLGNDKPVLD